MNEIKHTPGPWKVTEDEMFIVQDTGQRGFEPPVQIACSGSYEFNWANAHLIAATPELLETCEYFDYAVGGEPDEDYCNEEILEIRVTGAAVKQLKRAIAKAHGEEV